MSSTTESSDHVQKCCYQWNKWDCLMKEPRLNWPLTVQPCISGYDLSMKNSLKEMYRTVLQFCGQSSQRNRWINFLIVNSREESRGFVILKVWCHANLSPRVLTILSHLFFHIPAGFCKLLRICKSIYNLRWLWAVFDSAEFPISS